jgi:hypothetical protein
MIAQDEPGRDMVWLPRNLPEPGALFAFTMVHSARGPPPIRRSPDPAPIPEVPGQNLG